MNFVVKSLRKGNALSSQTVDEQAKTRETWDTQGDHYEDLEGLQFYSEYLMVLNQVRLIRKTESLVGDWVLDVSDNAYGFNWG